MPIVNIAAYKFVQLQNLATLKEQLKSYANQEQIKGTILLSGEGINIMLAGPAENIARFQCYLASFPTFRDLTYKKSLSEIMPFKRMLVKIKQEIITFGKPDVQPGKFTAAKLAPEQLKQWYEQGKDMLVLDARNDYEIKFGLFQNAINLNIDAFTKFPQALQQLPESAKDKPVITYCTGGIRCEKAAAYMLQQGFKEVYQLEGGILNYFQQCGDAYYQGDCFVFDERIAVDGKLHPKF